MIRRPPRSTLSPYTTLSRSENYRNLAETCLELGEPGEAAKAAESLASVSSGRPLETYFAACFMARCAAKDNKDHPHRVALALDRKSTRLNSSHSQISYAVFC